MKRLLCVLMAVLMVFAAGVVSATTIDDDMKFTGKVNVTGTLQLGGTAVTGTAAELNDIVTSDNAKSLTNKTIVSGYVTYNYTAGSGAAYSVTGSIPAPTVYKITGGSGTTTFTMSYTGTAASNKGKIFYILNSSSNTLTFKQSGATGVSAATLKTITVIGNGTDFERLTADQ
jgi:hypothetical protein